jgi:hypothetical protein
LSENRRRMRKMKKTVVIGICLVLLFLGVAHADISAFPNIRIRNASTSGFYERENFLVNQNPDPAEPGGYVEVRFKVENIGRGVAKDVVFEIMPEYPFSLDPGANAKIRIGDIEARQVGEEAYIIYYKLRVDKKAVQGRNAIKLRYSTDNGVTWKIVEPFDIRIGAHNPILSVDSIELTPEMIEPGKTADVTVKLKNLANSFLKNIRVKFVVLRAKYTATSLSYEEIPLSPIGSSDEKVIDFLDAGEEKELTFQLIADPDAETGVYKVPLQISYQDSLGTNYSSTSIAGVIVGSSPDMTAIVASSDILRSKTSGNVEVQFINKGLSELKFVNVVLSESEDYDILSNEEVYIGNIDSDDYESADFKIYVKTDKREISLPFTVEYKDAGNNHYKKELKPKLKIYSEKEAQRAGLKEGNRVVGWIIVVVIVVFGLLIYRWQKKKKKRNSND